MYCIHPFVYVAWRTAYDMILQASMAIDRVSSGFAAYRSSSLLFPSPSASPEVKWTPQISPYRKVLSQNELRTYTALLKRYKVPRTNATLWNHAHGR